MKSQVKTTKLFRFNEKSFFNTIIGLSPLWDYKPNLEYFDRNELDITLIDNIYLKSDCIDGSFLNGYGEPILYGFTSDKPPGFKIFLRARDSAL